MRALVPPSADGAASLRSFCGQAIVLRALGAVAGYLMVLLLARFASPSAFGWFGTGLAIMALGAAVAGLGQPMAVLRFAGVELRTPGNDRHLKLSETVTLWGAATTGLAIALTGEGLIALDIIPAPPGLFLWVGVGASGLAFLEWSSAVLRARRQLVAALIPREVVWRIGGLIAVLACIAFNYTIAPDLILLVAALLLCLGAIFQRLRLSSFAVERPTNGPGPERMTTAERRRCLRTGRDLWISAIAAPLSAHVGLLVLGFALSVDMAGFYLFLDRTAQLLVFVLTSVAAITTPMMAQLCRSGDLDRLRAVFLATCLYGGAAALGLFTLLVIFGPTLLSLVSVATTDAGPIGGYPLLLLMALAQVVNAATGPAAALLMVAEKEHLAMRLGLLFNALGIVSIGLSGLAFGLVGVVLVSASVTILRSIVTFACCLHILGLRGLVVLGRAPR